MPWVDTIVSIRLAAKCLTPGCKQIYWLIQYPIPAFFERQNYA